MIIRSAEFIKSAASQKGCPEPLYPEYAFLGRSNVGKSSLINMITNNRKLAKTSSTPGKTQLINHFLVNESWYLTDLPGYGFAKVPMSIKKTWEQLIRDYMLHRPNLVCSFVLIDVRHPPQKNDMDFLAWMGAKGLPFCLVLTKSDKLSTTRLNAQMEEFGKSLSVQWDPLPPYVVSSSKTKEGRDEILGLIQQWNGTWSQG